LTRGGERWCQEIAWPQQLQGRLAGEGRFLEHHALDDEEVKRPRDLRADHIGKVLIAGRDERHDQRSLGERVILSRNARKDFRQRSHQTDRHDGRSRSPQLVVLLPIV
jgi:hypothetical protein